MLSDEDFHKAYEYELYLLLLRIVRALSFDMKVTYRLKKLVKAKDTWFRRMGVTFLRPKLCNTISARKKAFIVLLYIPNQKGTLVKRYSSMIISPAGSFVFTGFFDVDFSDRA